MKFFIDTTNVDEIQKADKMGIISGITTNFLQLPQKQINEIAEMFDIPVIGAVKSSAITTEDIVKESMNIATHHNIVVKIPMSENGLKAVKILSSKGIKTNVTFIFSANQALLAAKAGANYVSPFMGFLGMGIELIQNITQIFKNYAFKTNIIAESIKNPNHILEYAMIGADIVAVPFSVLEQMTKHILTNTTIEQFKKDYKIIFG